MSSIDIELIVSVLAGLLSGLLTEFGVAGAFVSLPMLISVGIPPVVANGSSRVGTMALYTFSYAQYRRHNNILISKALILSLPLIIGALLGAIVATHIRDDFMEWIIISMVIIAVLFSVLSPQLTNRVDASKEFLSHLSFGSILILFAIGLYCGLILQAMSYLIYFYLIRGMGVEIMVAKGLKQFLSMIVTPFSFLIFVMFGQIDWLVAICLVIGASIGCWSGAYITHQLSRRSKRLMMILSLIISLVYLVTFIMHHYTDIITLL